MSKPLTAFFAKKPAVEKHTHEEGEAADEHDAKKAKTDAAPEVAGVPSLSTSMYFWVMMAVAALAHILRYASGADVAQDTRGGNVQALLQGADGLPRERDSRQADHLPAHQ